MIVNTILRVTIAWLKLPQENLLRHSLTRSSKENWPFEFRFNKIDKNARVLSFVQLHLYIDNEPTLVIFIARWAVCFVGPKSRMVEYPTAWCHKLDKYNPYNYNSRNCSFPKHPVLRYFVQFHCN